MDQLVLPGMEDISQFTTEIVHACPINREAITPCCGRFLFELPRTDRVALPGLKSTCPGPVL